MYQSIFQHTTIPILEQVARFCQARHYVLAGNIANLDTPGYKVRDLPVEDFHQHLAQAIEKRHRPTQTPAAPSPGDLAYLLSEALGNETSDGINSILQTFATPLANESEPNKNAYNDEFKAVVDEDLRTILYHDDSNVNLEQQVAAMVKNQMEHNLALALMASQFRLLQVAVSERV